MSLSILSSVLIIQIASFVKLFKVIVAIKPSLLTFLKTPKSEADK